MITAIAIDNEVTRRIRQHARAHLTTEVCGVLIGQHSNGIVAVRAAIEATHAAQAGTHVTFTQDAWEAIYRLKDERYPEQRIVGWYHSHPGFGVFLSEQDTFIHRNFFSSPDQLAWVYDPHSDEEGCFGWIDGEIHRVPSFSIIDNNADGVERGPKEPEARAPEISQPTTPRPAKQQSPHPHYVRWTGAALKYLTAMLLGFAIAYFLFPRLLLVTIDPVTGEPRLAPAPTHPSLTAPEPKAPSGAAPPARAVRSK